MVSTLQSNIESKKVISYQEAIQYITDHNGQIFYYNNKRKKIYWWIWETKPEWEYSNQSYVRIGDWKSYIVQDFLPSSDNITTQHCIWFIEHILLSWEPDNEKELILRQNHKEHIRVLFEQAKTNTTQKITQSTPWHQITQAITTPKFISTQQPKTNKVQTISQQRIIEDIIKKPRTLSVQQERKSREKPKLSAIPTVIKSDISSPTNKMSAEEQAQWKDYIKYLRNNMKLDDTKKQEICNYIDETLKKHLSIQLYDTFIDTFTNTTTGKISLQKIKSWLQSTTHTPIRKTRDTIINNL